MPILLDVDTGIDDALALLYLCGSPEAELLAVTCVAGNIDARQVAENTRAVLELAGRSDVEVALGRQVPLVRPLRIAPETHGPRGLGYAQLPPPRAPISPRHAADLMIEEARTRQGQVTLITTGPVTNLAVALVREPELPRLLKGLVIPPPPLSGMSRAIQRQWRSCWPAGRPSKVHRAQWRSAWT